MGFTANIIILMFCLSFAIYLGTPEHNSTLFLTLVTSGTNIQAKFVTLIALAGVATVAAGLFGISPSYALFAGITSFMIGFFTLPVDVFTSAVLPTDVKLLLGGIFGILFILSLLDFFKGTGGLTS